MKRGHDLSGIMKFATSPAWADHLRDALDDHLGPAMGNSIFKPTICPTSSATITCAYYSSMEITFGFEKFGHLFTKSII
jgi:hypothetical protein